MAGIYRFGPFRLDTRSARLSRDGRPIALRPKSFDVLLHLVRNRGRLVTKDELFETVWANVVVTDNSLVQCIKDIRQALGDAQAMIETVAKRGYVFTPEVMEGDDEPTGTGEGSSAMPAAAVPPRPAGRGAVALLAGTAAIGLVAAGLWLFATPQPASPPVVDDGAYRALKGRSSIAVVPFGIQGEKSDDYFTVGISEDIAFALGRFPELAVMSPSVVGRLRQAGTLDDGQLGVRYLVAGSVRRSPERIRITVQLTDLPRGILLWSETYDAVAADVLAIEDDIVVRIAGALAVKLTSIQQARLANAATTSMEAYDLVLQGRDLLTRLNRTSHSRARERFEQAIALDPQFGAALVGLGRVDLSAVAQGWTANPQAALQRAEGLARNALAIDESNPEAHVLLGRTYARMGEYARAIDVLRNAIALNPSNVDSHAGLGDALLWSGDVEGAIRSLEIATGMDPRLSAEVLFSLGAAYFLAGRMPEAARTFERVVGRREGNPFVFAMLAAIYAETGRDDDSRTAAVEVRALNPFFDATRFGSLFQNPAHRERLTRALSKTGL